MGGQDGRRNEWNEGSQERCAWNIWSRLVGAFEPTDLFDGVTLAAMTVARQAVTVRTKQDAVFVVAALATSHG